MATETDLVNFIEAANSQLVSLANRVQDEPQNRAQIYVQMARIRFSLQENIVRLKSVRSDQSVYATNGEKFFSIDTNGYHWTDSYELATKTSQANMEKLLIAYLGSDWPQRNIHIRKLPPHTIAW